MLSSIPISIVILSFLVAIVIHEAAHAFVADRLGDPTARMMGRLTLNPLAHLDPVGTVLVPAILIFFGSPFVIGWAKPVRFDPYNLENPRRDSALISLAGPASNLIVATLSSIILRTITIPFSPLSAYSSLFVGLIWINVLLALFNLIPIHPLDGGKILVGLLPPKHAYDVDRFLKQYGLIILFILIFPLFGGASPISGIISPAFNFLLNIFIPGSPFI